MVFHKGNTVPCTLVLGTRAMRQTRDKLVVRMCTPLSTAIPTTIFRSLGMLVQLHHRLHHRQHDHLPQVRTLLTYQV
jgi:hypothetical protein